MEHRNKHDEQIIPHDIAPTESHPFQKPSETCLFTGVSLDTFAMIHQADFKHQTTTSDEVG